MKLKLYFKGQELETEEKLPVINPYDQKPFAETFWAGQKEAKEALKYALKYQNEKLPNYLKIELLDKLAGKIAEKSDLFTNIITQEAGKPIAFSKNEVQRSIENIKIASAYLRNMQESQPVLDSQIGGQGKRAQWSRFPIGICFGISPYNFPLNLVLHKLLPALVSGSPIILKPNPKTPLASLLLNRLAWEVGIPRYMVQTLVLKDDAAGFLVSNPNISLVSFTGSQKVGWEIKKSAFAKKVILELGGCASILMDAPLEFEKSFDTILNSAFAYAGQVCISSQNLLVPKEDAEKVFKKLSKRMKIIKCGNPTDPEVTVGPLIDENHYMRTHARINNAKQFGAEVFSPSNSKTGIMPPHLTLGLNYNHDLVNKEVFGPVLNILTYDNFDQGMDIFNKLGSSLQGSIYTNNIQKLFSAYNRLKTAALIHNFPPAFRVDQMPYGGILESGFGREGIAYVVEEFSEKKLLVINEVMV